MLLSLTATTEPAEPFYMDINTALKDLASTLQTILAPIIEAQVEKTIAAKRLAIEETPIDAKKLAQFLGTTKAHIYSLAETGQIPFIPVGRYKKFQLSKVLAALERSGGATRQ